MSGFFEQIGDAFNAVSNPAEALKGVTDKVKSQAEDLSKDVFKKAIDSLGLSVVFETLAKIFPIQNLFSFLTGRANTDGSKESKNSSSTNLQSNFEKTFQESLTNGGNSVLRFLNNKRTQGIAAACYNLAENFRWKHFKQNLFSQQPSFQNNEEKNEMRASSYLTNEIDSYPVGTVFWVQKNIDPSDKDSRNAQNGNHWLTYVGKNVEGKTLIADQNGVRPVKDDDFYSQRFVHKAYPPTQTA